MAGVNLSLLVFKTHQLQKLREFYALVGFTFQREQHGRGPVHYAGQLGHSVFELYPLKEGEQVDSSTRIGLTISDLDRVLNLLFENELCERVEAKQTEWGYRAVVKDPDGRAVELCQS